MGKGQDWSPGTGELPAIDRVLGAPEEVTERDELAHAAADGPDPEVEAIRRICAALEALPDPSARRRVLGWASARFVTEPVWTPPPR